MPIPLTPQLPSFPYRKKITPQIFFILKKYAMKLLKLFSILFLLFSFSYAHSQSTPEGAYNEFIQKAENEYNSKHYEASASYYEKAFAIKMKSNLDLYNAACSSALAGDKDKAFEYLNAAIDNGWTNITHMKSDSDLNSLHSDSRWKNALAKLQKKLDVLEAGYDKPLQKKLLEVLRTDQMYRMQIDSVQKNYGTDSPEWKELIGKMTETDSINTIIVTGILDSISWAGKSVIGAEANSAIFLVIQHANLIVQEKYLPLMREAVRDGNASASSLALLEDRVLIRNGKKQLYGSQIGFDKETNKNYVLPLEDPDNVDKRRAEMGLGPLSDYIKMWQMTWNAEEFKKEQAARENK